MRKTRLDKGMSQTELAKILKVSPDTITGWELNRHQPPARLMKRIIKFLGYTTSLRRNPTIGESLLRARQIFGDTQEHAAKKIGCNETTVKLIEQGKRKPHYRTLLKAKRYIQIAEKKLLRN